MLKLRLAIKAGAILLIALVTLSFSWPIEEPDDPDERPQTCEERNTCDKAVFITLDEARAEIEPVYGTGSSLERPGKLLKSGNPWQLLIGILAFIFLILATHKTLSDKCIYHYPGVTDVHLKNDFWYANAFSDLVVINNKDISAGTFTSNSVTRYTDQLVKSRTYLLPEGRFFRFFRC